MSEATTGVAQANARVSTMPKLSPPSEGATSAFAARSSSVSSGCERNGADQPQTRAGAAPHLGPGPEEDLEALASLVPPDEHDSLLTTRRVCLIRDEDAVRDQLVVAREVAV